MPTTRLAPSPTGALHLGNARTFLVNWAMARQNGWQIIFRMEDIDSPRVKANAAREAIEILSWLGLDWDGEPIYQTADMQPYHDALTKLVEAGEAYPCRCTRSQILAASLSAPNAGDHEMRYPGSCRPKSADPQPLFKGFTEGAVAAWRVKAPNETFQFEDQFSGPQEANPHQEVGDFLVATKGGGPSYQLAVVVDDARQGVDQVIRSDDLLSSTTRQMLLYRLLELGTPPTYTHLPLVVGPDGRRLAKRHGDTRVSYYREQEATPERVIGLLAEWCGLGPREPMTTKQFLERFDLGLIPKKQIAFADADDSWLKAH